MCKQSTIHLSIRVILFCSTIWIGTSARSDVALFDASEIDAIHQSLDGTTLDVNRASPADLSAFPFLPHDQAEQIVEHRKANGAIPDLFALQKLLDWSDDDVEQLRPYLRFTEPRPVDVELTARLTAPRWKSSGSRILTRGRVSVGSMEAAYVTERDPLESSLVDHLGGYVRTQLLGTVLTVGDLRPGFGLGTLYSRSTRSSVTAPAYSLSSSGKLGTVSSSESGSLRGIALRIERPSLTLQTILGRTRWDATILEGIARLRTSGEHVSDNARAGANALGESSFVLQAGLRSTRTRLDLIWSRSVFELPLEVNGNIGAVHEHIGFATSIDRAGSRWFAEIIGGRVAREKGHGAAAGWRMSNGWLRIAATGRSLSPNYVAIRSAPSTAYSGDNERGFGLSAIAQGDRYRLEALIDRHWTIGRTADWPAGRSGMRSLLGLRIRAERRIVLDARLASRQERSRTSQKPDDHSRTLRVRLHLKSRPATTRLWVEGGVGRKNERGRAIAAGTDLSLGLGRLTFDGWGVYSSRSGTGVRLYGFRPESWGGRSILLLPSSGFLLTGRLTADLGPLKLTSVYHHLPTRRASLQLVVNP